MGGKHPPKTPFRATYSGRRGLASQEVEVIGKTRTHFHVRALAETGLQGFTEPVRSTWVQRDLIDFRPPLKVLPRRTHPSGHEWNAVLKPFSNVLVWTCRNCPEITEKPLGPGHSEDWFPAPKICPGNKRLAE